MTKISLLANPNQVRPKRFWGVYTKLKIFNMTNYKKGRIFNFLLDSINFLVLSSVGVHEKGKVVL